MKRMCILLVFLMIAMTASGCSFRQNTFESELDRHKINVDRVYSVDEFDQRALVFFNIRETNHKAVGLFHKNSRGWNFLSYCDITEIADRGEDISFAAYFEDKKDGLNSKPAFYMEYGVINNADIAKVRLIMQGENPEKDKEPKYMELDGTRVWYTVLKDKRIFNVYQGISADGKVIFDNRKGKVLSQDESDVRDS